MIRPAAVRNAVATLLAVATTGLHAQRIESFPTMDGGVVYADRYGSGDHAVVLAHGGRFTKESWAHQIPILVDAGFLVLAIDFRGRGQSRGGSAGADGVRYDVLAAVRYLRKAGVASVAVIGASFGGGAAAEAAAAAEPGEIDRIVLLAHSEIDHPERMTGSKLFITARYDTTGTGALRLTWIRNQFERATDPKELVIVDGGAHAQFLFETDQGDRVLATIIRFLAEP